MKKSLLLFLILLGCVNIVFSCDPTNPDDLGCDKKTLLEKTKEDPDLILDNPELAYLFSEEDFANNPEAFENAMAMTPDLASKFDDNGVSLFNDNRNAMAQYLAQKGDIGTYEGTTLTSISDDGTIIPAGPESTTIDYNSFKDSGSQVIIDEDGSVIVDGSAISRGTINSLTSEAGENPLMQVTGNKETQIAIPEGETETQMQFELFGGGQISTPNSVISGPAEGYTVKNNPDGTYSAQASKEGKSVSITNEEAQYEIEGKVTVLEENHLDVEKGTKVTTFVSRGTNTWTKKMSIVASDNLEFILNNPTACTNNCISITDSGELESLVVKNAPSIIGFYEDKTITTYVDGRELSEDEQTIIGKISDEGNMNEYFVVENDKVYSTPNFGETFQSGEIVANYLDEEGKTQLFRVETIDEVTMGFASDNIKITESWIFQNTMAGETITLNDVPYKAEPCPANNEEMCFLARDGTYFTSDARHIANDGVWRNQKTGDECSEGNAPPECYSSNIAYFDVENSPNRQMTDSVILTQAIELKSDYILPDLIQIDQVNTIRAGNLDATIFTEGGRQYVILVKEGRKHQYDVVTLNGVRYLAYGLDTDNPEYYDSDGVRYDLEGTPLSDSESNLIKSNVIGQSGITSPSLSQYASFGGEFSTELGKLYGTSWSSGYCAAYVSETTSRKYGLSYASSDAWTYAQNNKVVLQFEDLEGNRPDQSEFINEMNGAYSEGVIKPGMVVSMWYPGSKYAYKDTTHVGVIVGIQDGEIMVDHLFDKVRRQPLSKIVADNGIEIRAVITTK